MNTAATHEQGYVASAGSSRDARAAALPAGRQGVVLFDGVCLFCNSWVRRLIARDAAGRLAFAALQSDAARGLIERHTPGVPPPESVVLIDASGTHTRSDALIGIAVILGPPWSWLAALRVVPRSWRDAAYGVPARHRYRWFGRSESCMVPTPDVRARFLDADEPRP